MRNGAGEEFAGYEFIWPLGSKSVLLKDGTNLILNGKPTYAVTESSYTLCVVNGDPGNRFCFKRVPSRLVLRRLLKSGRAPVGALPRQKHCSCDSPTRMGDLVANEGLLSIFRPRKQTVHTRPLTLPKECFPRVVIGFVGLDPGWLSVGL